MSHSKRKKLIRLAEKFCSGGRLIPTLLVFAAHLVAGQSLVLTPDQFIPVADPQFPADHSWRVEFQLHDWTLPKDSVSRLISLEGVGFVAFIRPDGRLDLESENDQTVEREPCFVTTTGLRDVLIRFQRDVSGGKISCELWNYDGTGYNTSTITIKSAGVPKYTGGGLGGGATASLGFIHVFTTLVPLGSRPPVTADKGDWTNLTFDTNLNDSSGNAHNGSGTAVYAATPDQVPVAVPKTYGAPFWSNWTSLRAGFPVRLDGSSSFSLADASSAVSFRWQQLSGPSTLIWQNRNSAVPTVTGLIFGTYSFQLQVTDSAGRKAAATLTAGAVATDSNGVVVQANPAADAIFGPMIAFGKNPWSWADERNLRMEDLQRNAYATPPTWSTPAEKATVDYKFFDPYAGNSSATALSADITDTTLTIAVTSASALDLTTLPTEILVGATASWEIIRICSASGNTLTVCYDGRGYHYGVNGSYVRPASAWTSGTRVWQAKVTGTNTHFLTTMCSFGQGWPVAANRAVTSAGTISVMPGSATVTGNGTAWDGTQTSLAIAVFATHGGVPFTFFSYVTAASGSSLTLARPFPADADAGSYSYRIFSDQRNVVLHYVRADSTDGDIYFPTAGCESDTSLYLYFGWDNGYSGQHDPVAAYSYMDGAGYTGDFSHNYYDMGLAHYAFYFRSGLNQALTAARNIEDYWLRYPENAQGDAGGVPRDRGVLGVFAAAVLDGDRASNWSGLRTYANQGLQAALRNNCDDDLRETAYQLSWLALAAQFDPDPAQRAMWQSGLSTASYNRDNNCKRPDDSFATGFYWNPGSLKISTTQNSQTATAVNGTFPSNMCYSTTHGTGVATNGSALLTALTSAFLPPSGSYKLIVGGTLGGAPYDLVTQFDYNSPESLTMAALWPGDSGVVYWSIENNDNSSYVLTIAQGPDDTANFGHITSCSLIDSTHIELYRPWPTGSGTFSYFEYNLVGRGTQTFMAGIKSLQMRYASQAYAPYQTLAAGLANWVGTVGFDPATKGIYYGRGFPQCEPAVTDSGITDVQYRVVSCIENSDNPTYAEEARARNAEAQNAMTMMYLANPTDKNRSIGDTFYGATYGASGYTAQGYFSDGTTSSNLDDVSLGSYKWPGFFFGIGMAHQWPAVRLGGAAPPQYRTVYISVNLTTGSSARILVTAPSGATQAYSCGNTSPCPVKVDDRQGAHWYRIQYLSDAGKVVAQSAPDLLSVPGQALPQ